MSGATHIVVVDDEPDLREMVVDYLVSEGLSAIAAADAAELDAILAVQPVALVVLDVNMPGEDGFSVARRLRARGGVGVIMLTAKHALVDRVVGLEIGADDYLAKPFEPRELLARIRAVMRRTETNGAAKPEQEAVPGIEYSTEFWVHGHHGLVRVHVDAIDWIEAAKDYAILHTSARSHMLRATMAALERQLDPQAMIRVHRSAFVRPEAVAELKHSGKALTVVLKTGTAVHVGPNYADALKRRLQI